MARIKINETFFPGQEIIYPKCFSGRKELIEIAVKALTRAGTCLLVYGDRGVGKTSFVEMIKLLAKGNVDLLYKYGLHKKYSTDSIRYKVVSIECDADVDTSTKVLQRLITSPEGIRGLLPRQLEEIESKVKDSATFDLLKDILSFSAETETTYRYSKVSEESIFELFTNLILIIQRDILAPNEGLLIVVDEFDQVKENRKLASLIKTLAKNKVKFLYSGIAESYENLLQGHRSVMRQLFQGRIKVEPMTSDEIDGIFDLAQENNGGQILFNRKFRDNVVYLSNGYPYYAQLFGQLALDEFVDINGINGRGTINSHCLNKGIEKLMQFEPEKESMLEDLISGEEERKIIIEWLAHKHEQKVKRADLFQYCENRGIVNPKQELTNLLSYRYKDVVGDEIKVLDTFGKELIFFSDPLFKIYVRVKGYTF